MLPTKELRYVVSTGLPAILTRQLEDQVARKKWGGTLEVPPLADDRIVTVVRGNEPRIEWNPRTGLDIVKMRYADFINSAYNGDYVYLQDDLNYVPELKPDFSPPQSFKNLGIIRTKLWMSGCGLITPLHYDPVETLHWVVKGEKTFRLFSPGLGGMAANGWRTDAPFISKKVADEIKHKEEWTITLYEGDLLYLPAYWWHEVTSDASFNVSLNFVWWAKKTRTLRRLPQFLRTIPHLRRQLKRVKAAKAASGG